MQLKICSRGIQKDRLKNLFSITSFAREKGFKYSSFSLNSCKNEEVNLDRCIKSVDWADEIFVVDSQSSDKTPEIAQKHGAKVVQFKYQGMA